MKAGGWNDQTRDQAWDVGTSSDGAEYCALADPGLGGWRRTGWWWRSLFRYGPGSIVSTFVLPKAVGHKSHPQGQEDQQAVWYRRPSFAQGYRAAYATIYDRNDYAAAIEQLKSLGHDDHPNLANLIGYSYRKLGDYKLSQVWYERALKADPNHVLTWQYYGLWQNRTGQPRSSAISFEPDRCDLRDRLRGVSFIGGSTGKAAGHRPRLLSVANPRQSALADNMSAEGCLTCSVMPPADKPCHCQGPRYHRLPGCCPHQLQR